MRTKSIRRTPVANLQRSGARIPAQAGASRASSEDRVIQRIRDALLDHRLVPGTKLREVALADVFGVTRGVIRNALLRLAGDHLVDLRPNRSAVVANPSVAESRDLYAARRVIECALVDRAARAITPARVRELRDLIKRESDAYRRGEIRAGLKLSIEFHLVLGRIANNSVLAGMLEQLMIRTPLAVVAYRSDRADPYCANREHHDIVDALAKGSADRAVKAVQDHLVTLEGQLDLREEEENGSDLAAIFGQQD
jgi:DNA-binding GntR family transcriptional regulator